MGLGDILLTSKTAKTLDLKSQERKTPNNKVFDDDCWTGKVIGVENAVELSEVLKVNTVLTSLDLSGEEEERRTNKENQKEERKSELQTMKLERKRQKQ